MTVYAVPITKAKKNLPVDADAFSDEVYEMIFAEGLKTILNKNMSKIGVKDLDADELAEAQAAAYAKAEETLENLKAGNLKKRKAAKESRDVITEARRIAKEAIKASLKEAGKKVSGFKSKQLTEAADEMIADDPTFIEKARENVAKMKQRETITIKPKEGTALSALIAKAETAKPKVAPPKKPKADAAVVAAKGKGKAKAQPQASAH